jgi:hypothetical protein
MHDNVIRAVLVLAVPLLLVYAICAGAIFALKSAVDEFTFAWRDPQSTRFNHWKFWA